MTKTWRILLASSAIMTACALSGCSSCPPDNVGFAQVKDLNEFCGTYRNAGQTGNAQYKVYLSYFFWSDIKPEEHKRIESVKISRKTDGAILVSGIENGNVTHERTFVEGKDFDLDSDGTIKIRGFFGVPLPVVGIAYKSEYIGIDLRKDGKYKSRTTLAGLVALLIPLAWTGTDEVRFKRLDDPASHSG